MNFDRRQAAAILACALCAASACHRSSQSDTSATPTVAVSTPTPPPAKAAPSPDQIIRMRAPPNEIAVLDGKLNLSSGVNSPNDALKGQAQMKTATQWKNVVQGIGRFKDWAGYTKAIYVSGRIEIGLSDGLLVFADLPRGSKLIGIVANLRENSQYVLISGKISQSFLDASDDSDDPNYPTCFESHFGQAGCQIELTDIRPLP